MLIFLLLGCGQSLPYVNVYVQEEKGEFPQNLLFREISIKDSRLKKYYDCEVRSISPFESHMGYDVMDVYLNDKEEKKNNTNHQVKRKKYKIIGRKNKGQQNK